MYRIKFSLIVAIMCVQIPPCFGQNTGAAKVSKPTRQRLVSISRTLAPRLLYSSTGQLARQFGPRAANGLPVCQLDSFVTQAGSRADQIYGDEGSLGPTPYEGFKPENRIDAGIFGSRDAGLTTGHQSTLPAAWGGDEYVGGTEWVRNNATYSDYDLSPFTSPR